MKKMKMVTALLVGSLILGACGNTVITSKNDSTSQGELSANKDNTTQNSTDSNLEEGSINETPEFVRSDNPIEAVPGDEPLVICTEEMYKQNVRALVDIPSNQRVFGLKVNGSHVSVLHHGRLKLTTP